MARLDRWVQLTDFLTLLLWTGQVANGRPQSAFLISDPGQGKTELMERFRPNLECSFWSDVTYRTILMILQEALRHKTVTHLFCSEFQKVINRKAVTAESTLTLILQAMEEGVGRIGFGPNTRDLKGQKLGIIAATTVTSISSKPFLITELAMDSRAFFIDARGTVEEIREIENRIARGDVSALRPVKLKFPEKKIEVKWTEPIAKTAQTWVREMDAAGVNVYGIRTYMRFLRTLQGVALKNGHDVITKADVDELYSYHRFWLKPPPMPGEQYDGDGI